MNTDGRIELSMITDAIERCMNDNGSVECLRFFTAGTGIPDHIAIEFFKPTNVIVVTRCGHEYMYGSRIKSED